MLREKKFKKKNLGKKKRIKPNHQNDGQNTNQRKTNHKNITKVSVIKTIYVYIDQMFNL